MVSRLDGDIDSERGHNARVFKVKRADTFGQSVK